MTESSSDQTGPDVVDLGRADVENFGFAFDAHLGHVEPHRAADMCAVVGDPRGTAEQVCTGYSYRKGNYVSGESAYPLACLSSIFAKSLVA